MISEWDVDAYLETPAGTLFFNQPIDTDGDRRFVLNPRRCSSVLGVRTTDDDIPQADGAIPHRRFRTGYRIHLAFELVSNWNDGDGVESAAGADLVEMMDLIGLNINSMIRTGLVPGAPNARYFWTPTGSSDDRMFDRLQLAGEPTFGFDGDLGCSLYEVDLDTTYPYYIAATETDTALAAGDSVIIVNDGNTDYFPAVLAYGPYDSFVLTNNSVVDLDGNPLQLVYESLLPGAESVDPGDYVEFSFFGQTAYLNGNQASRKAGIDMTLSDFFPLVPGDNDINLSVIGGDGTDTVVLIKSNDAWA